MFHVVTAGRCWLEVEGDEPRLLQQGSLALVPHGTGHCIRSSPTAEAEPLFEIPVEQVSDRYEIMRYGGDGELTQLTCGVVRFDHVAGQKLIKLLPRVLQIDTWDNDESNWLQSTLRFIAREARELRPGGETVITHLADILIIQAIRSWIDSAARSRSGLACRLTRCSGGKSARRDPPRRLKKTGPWRCWPKRSACRARGFPLALPSWWANRPCAILRSGVCNSLVYNFRRHRILSRCLLIVLAINPKPLFAGHSNVYLVCRLGAFARKKWGQGQSTVSANIRSNCALTLIVSGRTW